MLRGMGYALAVSAFCLCAIPVTAAEQQEAKATVVYEQGFESTIAEWKPVEGITLKCDTTAHSGKQAMSVTGKETGKMWRYAGAKPLPLESSRKYRLSCWMKVDKVAPEDKAPHMKVGLNAPKPANKWYGNKTTTPYDMKKLGTWQCLDVTFETPADPVLGEIALEKGAPNTMALEVALSLDDVKLEMLPK